MRLEPVMQAGWLDTEDTEPVLPGISSMMESLPSTCAIAVWGWEGSVSVSGVAL